MKKTIMAAALAAMGVFAAGAANAVTYATNVVSFTPGAGTLTGTGNPTNFGADALGAPDGNFVSLGNGGELVLSFGTPFFGPGAIFEITNGCGASQNGGQGGTCSNWPEQVEVLVSDTADSGFVSQGLVKNGGTTTAPKTTTFSITGGPFTFVKLIDKTADLPWTGTGADPRFASNSGFDVDAISVSAIPLPAAAWLLLGGLGAMGLVGRKRRAA